MNKKFKKLKEENEKMRDEISELYGDWRNDKEFIKFWNKINALIENELEQEEMCNE